MKHDLPIRVRSLQRNSYRFPGPGGSEVTIVVDTLEETPHLGVMKARIDRMVEMEKLLREAIGPDTDPNRVILKGVPWFDRACAILEELDAAGGPRAPGPPTDPWDQLHVDGEIAPAYCHVRFEKPMRTGPVKGQLLGYDPGQFDVELLVTPENVAGCEDLVRKLWPHKPGEMAKLVPHQVAHPALALRGIRQVAIIGVRSGEGPEPGTRLFVLRAVEYKPKAVT
jgi:hypothetical protein